MAIGQYGPRKEFVGLGNLASYDFNFKITALSQLLVIVTDATFVETFQVRGDDTTYLDSVSFDATAGGGTVVLVDNLPTGHHLTLLLAEDEPKQAYEFKDKGSFTLSRIEQALDALTIGLQRVHYLASRALRLSDNLVDTEPFDNQVPINTTDELVENNAGKVLAIGDDNASLQLGPTVSEIIEAATASAASASQAAISAAASAADAAASALDAAGASTSAAAAAASATEAGNYAANAEAAQTAAEAAAAAADGAPVITGTRALPDSILAAVGIPFTSEKYYNIKFIKGNSGATNITFSPQIHEGSILGQRLVIFGCSDTDTVQLDDGDGLITGGQSLVHGADSVSEWMWNDTAWVLMSFNGLMP